jgi:glutamine synthetase
MEFYLFKTDMDGKPVIEPYDEAGYMDIAPDDKGENIRREICLTLEQMESSPKALTTRKAQGKMK